MDHRFPVRLPDPDWIAGTPTLSPVAIACPRYAGATPARERHSLSHSAAWRQTAYCGAMGHVGKRGLLEIGLHDLVAELGRLRRHGNEAGMLPQFLASRAVLRNGAVASDLPWLIARLTLIAEGFHISPPMWSSTSHR